MKEICEFFLTRKAKKAGGDRYECGKSFAIYIPQTISRSEGTEPIKNITVTFEGK